MHRKAERAAAQEKARLLADDEWQQFVSTETARAIGQWLEAKGRLDRPIHRLTLADLRGIADQAITRWIVLASFRLQQVPETRSPEKLGWLLLDRPFV